MSNIHLALVCPVTDMHDDIFEKIKLGRHVSNYDVAEVVFENKS